MYGLPLAGCRDRIRGYAVSDSEALRPPNVVPRYESMAELHQETSPARAEAEHNDAPSQASADTSAAPRISTAERAMDKDPEALEGRLSFICDLWQRKRGSKLLPSRADLDPAEFHRLWPVTFLLERDADSGEWHVRFAGAAYSSVYGREITGASVREIVPKSLAPQVLADLRRCIEGREPIVIDGETNWPDRGNVYRYQRVLLPYGTEAGEVTHLLGVAAFYNSAGATVF